MEHERQERGQCPWCEGPISVATEAHRGSHGTMRITRCAKCHKLISVRLQGEPVRIIKKELIEGGAP
jgi:hypothetical protein